MPGPELPPVVRPVTTAYLAALDAAAPGLVEGLYLTGSVAYGDFRPGGPVTRWGPSGARSSDIDFVATTARPVDDSEWAAVGGAHAQLRRRFRRPHFDGCYVTRDELRGDPAHLRGHPEVHDGRLRRSAGPPGPVLWHELAGHSLALRGRPLSADDVWTDRDTLVTWCRGNLGDYWRRWLQHSRRLDDRHGWAALTHYGPVWGVLGVSRIDHTITTGRLVSKTGAGAYARATFDPRWHPIIEECVRIRTAGGRWSRYRSPLTRRRDALAFVAMILQRHGVDTGQPVRSA